MAVTLKSPYPFPERFLFYGGGGSGKSNNSMNIARYVSGDIFVIEADYSAAWQRGISLEYSDIADRVTIIAVSDWPSHRDAMAKVLQMADPARDWIVCDSASPCTYQWVQDWTMEQMYGDDMATMMMELRRDSADTRAYMKAKGDLMQWEIVKKEYAKFWRAVQSWQGHMILTAEAKEISSWNRDDAALKRQFGPVGQFPAGQDTIRYAMSTTLFFDHPSHERWTMTTVKDRNRPVQDAVRVDEFALDYLLGVAGWTR